MGGEGVGFFRETRVTKIIRWSSDGVMFAVVSRPQVSQFISVIGGLGMGSPALPAGASVALLDHRVGII